MIGDLHCHTRLSDGSLGIDEVLFFAKRAGLDFISITDHDTLAGAKRAAVLGKRYGINVIPGAEFSCKDYKTKRKVHILCYMPQSPDRLEGLCMKMLESRNKAGKEMLSLVMKQYPITAEQVSRYSMGSKALYKAHIMNAIIDLGYDNRIYGEVYQKLLSEREGSCYVPCSYPDVMDVLPLIREAGGLSVMAHPAQYDSLALLEQLAEKELIDGVELYHPRNSEQDRRTIAQIADRYGLVTTGGSDFHGYYAMVANPIGTCVTTKESLDALFRLRKKL